MDHYSLPAGAAAFSTSNAQYIDGGRIGTYYENRCESECPSTDIFVSYIIIEKFPPRFCETPHNDKRLTHNDPPAKYVEAFTEP